MKNNKNVDKLIDKLQAKIDGKNIVSETNEKTNEVSHTPTPWKADEATEYQITIVAPWSAQVTPETKDGMGDYRGIHICALQHQYDNPCVSLGTARANAALIVRAVNSHEQLVSALKLVLKGLENGRVKDSPTIDLATGKINTIKGRVKQALKSAGESHE